MKLRLEISQEYLHISVLICYAFIMTIRDRKDIKRLYFFNNYLQATIAKLYGLSDERVRQILTEDQTTIFNTGIECILCSNEEAVMFFIDGNETNIKPQNMIMLCESDKRRITHLQLRRRRGFVKPQF